MASLVSMDDILDMGSSRWVGKQAEVECPLPMGAIQQFPLPAVDNVSNMTNVILTM